MPRSTHLALYVLSGLLALHGCNCNPQPVEEEHPDAGATPASSSSSSSGGVSGGASSSGGSSGPGASSLPGSGSGAASSSGSDASASAGSSAASSSGAAGSSGMTGASSGGMGASSTSTAATSGSAAASSSSGGGAVDGGPGSADGGMTGQLSITRLAPTAGYRGEDTLVVIVGRMLRTAAVVRFEHRETPAAPGATLTLMGSANAEGTQLAVLVPQDLTRPEGFYQVTVEDGAASAVSPDDFRVSVAPPPTLSAVSPVFAYAGSPNDTVLSDRILTLTGTGFLPGASVEFTSADRVAEPFESPDAQTVSATTLRATFPSESYQLPLGRYFVTLINPDGQRAPWLTNNNGQVARGTIEVRNVPPPQVTSISPSRPSQGNASPLTILGTDFQPGATTALIASDGTVCPTLGTTAVSGMETSALTATLNTAASGSCSLAVGAFFLVRVTNPDGQFGDFAALHIYSNATGKLGVFTVSPPGEGMVHARSRHDSTVYFDDACGATLLVAGGEGRLAGGGGTVAPVLEVERALVTPFGQLSRFQVLPTALDDGTRTINRLVQPRVGVQLQALGGWVFAMGGMDASGAATSTVERATVLTAATSVGAADVADAGAGLLPEGRFHYRVAAVLPDGAVRFSGEGLPSRAVSGRAQPNGALAVRFEAYPNAVAYRIYRSSGPNQGSGSVRLIAHGNLGTPVPGVPGLLQHVDRGEGAAISAPGNTVVSAQAGGTLPTGFYGYRITSLRGGVESSAGQAVVGEATAGNQRLEVRFAPVPGASGYRIYRTPSTGLTGSVADAARAAVFLSEVTATSFTDDGTTAPGTPAAPEGEEPLTRGMLSRFSLDPQSAMGTARQGHEALRVPLDTMSATTQLYVMGGRDGRTGATLRTVERAVLGANGHLTFTAASHNGSPVQLQLPRTYFAAVTNATQREALGCATTDAPPDPCANPDVDLDGYRRVECGGTDCDDTRATTNLGANEQCTDGRDNDCDTLVDNNDPDCMGVDAGVPDAGSAPDGGSCADEGYADFDMDGFVRTTCGGTDCNDGNPAINPGVVESTNPADGACGNGVDEDCDGLDAVCRTAAVPTGPWATVGPEEIYLLAAAGSQGLSNGMESVIPLRTAQQPYAEMAFVRPDGTIEAWLPVGAPNGYGANGYGVEALLYYNFLYVFGGSVQTGGQHVDRTSACLPASDDDPTYAPHCSNISAPMAWNSTELLTRQDSTSSGLSTARLFPSAERVFSTLFILGGTDAQGNPLASYDRAAE